MRRYSRGYLQEKYSASSALFVSETAKLLLSAVYVCTSDAPSDVPAGSPLSKYAHLIRRSLKMAVPAVIYLIMNLLGFLSLAHIDASTFAIVSQMKVRSLAPLPPPPPLPLPPPPPLPLPPPPPLPLPPPSPLRHRLRLSLSLDTACTV